MIVGLFRNNQPLTSVLLLLAGVVMWFPILRQPVYQHLQHAMPLFELFQHYLATTPLLANISALCLILAGAFILFLVFEKHDILTGRTYLPSLMYVTLMSCAPSLTTLHPIMLANVFLMLTLDPLISLYRNEAAYPQVFNIALLMALAVLCYFPAIVLLPLIWLGLIIYHPFNIREWIVGLMGIATPFFFVFVYYHWYDRLDGFWFDRVTYPILTSPHPGKINTSTFYLIAALFLLIVLSTVKVLEHFGTTSVKTGKTMGFMVWFILLSFVSVFIMPGWTIRDFSLMGIPFAIFIGNYFALARAKWLAELMFLFLIVAIVMVRVSA